MGFWYGFVVDFVGYGLFDPVTGLQTTPSAAQVELAGKENATGLGFYIAAPFWMVYFLVSIYCLHSYTMPLDPLSKNVRIFGAMLLMQLH